jgi:hypothetical protein
MKPKLPYLLMKRSLYQMSIKALIVTMCSSARLWAEDNMARKTIEDFVGTGMWYALWFYWILSATIIIKGAFMWNDGKIKSGTIWIIMGILSFGLPDIVMSWTADIDTM